MQVTTDRGDVGVRIDRVLLRHLSTLPGISRNRVQRLIDGGAVLVNGRAVTRAAARVGAGDVIAIELPARKVRPAILAEDVAVDVRYEDDVFLVVNKPPGLVSHPAIRHPSGTLLNGLLAYARGQWTPALVSRLDKGTSGLLLVAKSKRAHTTLQRMSNANAVEKEYLAIVRGRPPRRGTIDLNLDRDPWDARRVTVRDRGGVPSVTRFDRLTCLPLPPDSHLSLMRCRLITGRMHQIRVHLAARGWPIVGDVTYGVKFAGIDRQALHSWRLAFPHPLTGHPLEISAEPPADMAALLERFHAGEGGEHGAER